MPEYFRSKLRSFKYKRRIGIKDEQEQEGFEGLIDGEGISWRIILIYHQNKENATLPRGKKKHQAAYKDVTSNS